MTEQQKIAEVERRLAEVLSKNRIKMREGYWVRKTFDGVCEACLVGALLVAAVGVDDAVALVRSGYRPLGAADEIRFFAERALPAVVDLGVTADDLIAAESGFEGAGVRNSWGELGAKVFAARVR